MSSRDAEVPSRAASQSVEPAALPRDKAMTTTLWAVGALGALFSVVGLVVFDGRTALGIAIGALIALANLWLFTGVVRGVLSGGRRSRIWILIGAVKIFVLFGGIWLLWRSGWLTPLHLIIGYGSLPLGITLGNFLNPKPAS